MSETVCITGGTGLVGSALSNYFTLNDYQVSLLSRSSRKREGISIYFWDIHNQKLEAEAVKNSSHIIHLAGAGIADKGGLKNVKRSLGTAG